MPPVLMALLFGILAGAIDIIPMFKSPMAKQKPFRFSIAALFFQWVLIGLFIPFISWDLSHWAKGLIIGCLGMMPTMLQAYGRLGDNKIAARIIIHGGILGALLAVAESYFVRAV